MRIILLILFASNTMVSASLYSQEINLKLKNTSLEIVFNQIEKISGHSFIYEKNVLKGIRNIDISLHNSSLENAMTVILKDQPLEFVIRNKFIVISNKKSQNTTVTKTEAVPQFAKIIGTIKDAMGIPIPGVSVKIKNKAVGTSTNESGVYTINAEPGDILVFSMVGFTTKEVPYQSGTALNVTLELAENSLEDIVVVGYGKQKRTSITGSVAAVSGAELVKSPVPNLTNSLIGRLPGLRAVQRSGEPGNDNSTIDIRGFGNALIIVDGVPLPSMSQLDPNEIESVSILKDASAAIYGVRAANGVVLVTTKKGTIGKPAINYSTYFGLQSITRFPGMLNAAQFAELSTESYLNAYHIANNFTIAPVFQYPKDMLEKYQNGTLPSTDWFGSTVRNNVPQSYQNVNVNGGTEDIKYFFNIGYLNQDGIWKSDATKFKRYNFRSNISAKIGKNLTAELNVGGRLEDRIAPSTDPALLMIYMARSFPTAPMYANNNPEYFAPNNNPNQNSTFLMDIDNAGYAKSKTRNLSAIGSLVYEIPNIDGLSAKALFSYQSDDVDGKNYQKKYELYSYNAANDSYNVAYTGNNPSKLRVSTNQNDQTLFQASLNYNKRFAEKHNVTGLLLFESQTGYSSLFNAYKEFLLDGLDELFAGTPTNQSNNGSSSEFARLGYVGKFNYDYQSKYLLEFGFRYDGTYKVSKEQKYGFFPNISLGWRLNEEAFLKDVKAIDNLKLRASWGKVGDDGGDNPLVVDPAYYIFPFQYITGFTYPNSNYLFGSDLTPGLIDSGLPNPLLTWYNSTTKNVGAEISLWKGLLGAEFDAFYRKRSGLLANRVLSLPGTFGANLPQENLNEDITKGIELVLTHKNRIGELDYSVSPNLTFTRTKNGYIERSSSTNATLNYLNNTTNRWRNLYWGYVATGQFQSQEEINMAPVQDEKANQTILPGDIKYQDINGDGIIDSNDQTVIGKGATPETFYGLNLSLNYKNLDFSLLLQGATGFNAYFSQELQNPISSNSNGYSMFMDRWHRADLYDVNSAWIPGKYPSTINSGSNNNRRTSSFWLKDATYLRVKNFEIGYTLAKTLTEKIGIKKARIYTSGQNIFTFDNINFIDPEAPSGRGAYYPQQKIWTLGLNVAL